MKPICQDVRVQLSGEDGNAFFVIGCVTKAMRMANVPKETIDGFTEGLKMQTKEQVERAFRTELQALLDKYGAELEARDHWQGYAECGEDVRMTVDIPGVWGKNGEPVREYTEIDLGRWLIGERN